MGEQAGRALCCRVWLWASAEGAVMPLLLWVPVSPETEGQMLLVAPAAGTPGSLCCCGGLAVPSHAGILQRAGFLLCARLEPGEVSVPASHPLRHCPASGQAHRGSPEQLLYRAREGLMPPSFPRKAPASGVSLPLAAADMAGLFVTSAQPPPGRDLPGLRSSPAVPAALQRLLLHHRDPGWDPGCPLPGGQEQAELRACLRPAPALA